MFKNVILNKHLWKVSVTMEPFLSHCVNSSSILYSTAIYPVLKSDKVCSKGCVFNNNDNIIYGI